MTQHEAVLRNYLSKYKHPNETRQDILSTLTLYADLRPTLSPFVFNDGTRRMLVQLEGTIPVNFKGSIYNIPISIWVLDTHPYNPPVVCVKPTNTMQIRPGRYVDAHGKVDMPFIREWRHPASDLLSLVQILAFTFGEECPIFSIAAGQRPPPMPGGQLQEIPLMVVDSRLTPIEHSKFCVLEMSYKHPNETRQDILNLLTEYANLRPTLSPFVFNDGTQRMLVQLEGTIPVNFKGSVYNIPISIWVLDTHPYNPPMVCVKPTNTMQIRPGRYVDANGKVDMPFIREWRHPASDLLSLVQILAFTFGEECPIFSIAAGQRPPPMPGVSAASSLEPASVYIEEFGTNLAGNDAGEEAGNDAGEEAGMVTDIRAPPEL